MFYLDYKSGLPIYEQIYRYVTEMAALGGMQPNEKLPAVRAWAVELSINPNTVQKAYQMLERDGVIYSVPGKGSFIAGTNSAMQQQQELGKQRLREAIDYAFDCGLTGEALAKLCEEQIAAKEAQTHD